MISSLTFFGTLNWIDNRPLQIDEYKDLFRKALDTRSREPSVITWPCPPARDQLHLDAVKMGAKPLGRVKSGQSEKITS